MSIHLDPKSPWGKRLWIPEADFEPLMLNVHSKAQDCFTPGRGVDVDAILLRVYGVTPDFGDIDEACLGRTRFELDGTYSVMISRTLAEEAESSVVARRRLRSTLAHELAHIVYHGVLHPVHHGPGLFPELAEAKGVMCRQDSIDRKVQDQPWWEYQANRGMSALLLPSDLVKDCLSTALSKRGHSDMRAALHAECGKAVLRELMDVFDVSFEMTLYRLQELGFMSKHVGQGGLTV
jgi:hypothetical protein